MLTKRFASHTKTAQKITFRLWLCRFKTNVGSVDQILSGSINLEINTDIIPVALPYLTTPLAIRG